MYDTFDHGIVLLYLEIWIIYLKHEKYYILIYLFYLYIKFFLIAYQVNIVFIL